LVQKRSGVSGQVIRGESVLFVGESHVLSFAERIVLRGDAPPLTCQSYFLANAVCLGNLTTAAGVLCSPVRNALRAARLLVETRDDEPDESVYATNHVMWRRVARRRFSAPPLLVFSLGSYDVFAAIDQFSHDDFHLPALPQMHKLAGPFASRTLPDALDAETALAWFTARVQPFRTALTRLRELGFTRIAALAIMPPTLDDGVCRYTVENLGGPAAGTPAKLRPAFRYKAALVLNALIAQACEAEGATFLDSWPLLTHDGLVRSDVLADEAHLNDAAVEQVLLRLVAPAATYAGRETSGLIASMPLDRAQHADRSFK